MTIHEIMTTPNAWQDSEVVITYQGQAEPETYTLCSDEDGFYLQGNNGVVIRHFEELGDIDVDRLQISIVY